MPEKYQGNKRGYKLTLNSRQAPRSKPSKNEDRPWDRTRKKNQKKKTQGKRK